MSRLVLLAIFIIILVAGMFLLIIALPEKPLQCKSGDGLCPKNCSYETDKDCLKSKITTLGEVRHCLADIDCVVVKPFCGNPNCGFSDYECNSGKFCVTAIGKDYLAAWQSGKAKCLQPIDIKCEPLENFQAKCVLGECIIAGKS